MERFPDVEVVPVEELARHDDVDIKQEIKIMEAEDLKQDPFDRTAVVPTKPTKSKRKLSDKQKETLAKGRLTLRERREQQRKERESGAVVELKPTTKPSVPVKDEFDSWMKNMDKFHHLVASMEAKKKKQQEEEERKERELEAKYFKRFQERQKTIQQPTPEPALKSNHDEYGEYAHYFC